MHKFNKYLRKTSWVAMKLDMKKRMIGWKPGMGLYQEMFSGIRVSPSMDQMDHGMYIICFLFATCE